MGEWIARMAIRTAFFTLDLLVATLGLLGRLIPTESGGNDAPQQQEEPDQEARYLRSRYYWPTARFILNLDTDVEDWRAQPERLEKAIEEEREKQHG